MKGLILYRSHYGNTKRVAEAIAQSATSLGHLTTVREVRERVPNLTEFDFAFVGSPTRIARASSSAKAALRRLKGRSFGRKPVVLFDTYGPKPTAPEELEKAKRFLDPGAAGILLETARALGLNAYATTLRCEVKGMKGPLGDRELERAASFTAEFLRTIHG